MIPAGVKTRLRGVRDAVWILLVVAGFIIYADYTKGQAVESIKSQLNTLGYRLCIEGQRVDAVGKYNNLTSVLIRDYAQRERENIARGDFEKARINAQARTGIRLSRINSAPQDCTRPLLP